MGLNNVVPSLLGEVAYTNSERERRGGTQVLDTITMSSVAVAAREQIYADLGGEAVILALESGDYYSLNEVGTLIWSLVREPKTLLEIRDAILDKYDVESERCEEDLLALIKDLAAESLIELKNGSH
jgi:hypothetical protein